MSRDRVAAHLRSLGPDARRLRRLLRVLLSGGRTTIDAAVAASGSPRRDVEHLVRLMGDDARRSGHEIEVLTPAAYADLALAGASARELPVAAMDDALKDAPAADKQLDHVAATAETVLRRAAW